jgi:hypothetical protein
MYTFKCSLVSQTMLQSKGQNSFPKTPVSKQFIIVHVQSNLFARLERWHPNIRTSRTTESVPECTVSAAANLALHRKVNLVHVICRKLDDAVAGPVPVLLQDLVLGCSLRRVFGRELLSETAGAVLASSASFLGRRETFWSYIDKSVSIYS